MTRESPRRVAQEKLMAYHEAGLNDLVWHVGEAVDGFRANQLDAFEVDQVLFHYGRAAKELWKFCNLSDVEFAASLVDDDAPIDWWERGAPRRRR